MFNLSVDKLQFTEYRDNSETSAATLVMPSCDIDANQNVEYIASEIRRALPDL